MTTVKTVTSPVVRDGTADLASARRVLELEREGLKRLAAALDDSFVRALDVLAATRGRVVVTGMGKSGHVGNKIAATLASTGTPAQFVHPAEASHGDLGMIHRDDSVLALSNSGETSELADLIQHAKRFRIPLVSITGRAGSTLVEASTVALVLPPTAEACPMGIAPTTSTTAMMALGDALSVALLERKGFSVDDFHALHPGGRLGRLLLKVGDIMHVGDAVPLAATATLMSEALLTMTAKGFGTVGIVDDGGRLLGVVTDGDLRRHMGPHMLAADVQSMMTRDPAVIGARVHAGEALRIMNERAITGLFVTEDGRPVGFVHIHDCLRAGVA